MANTSNTSTLTTDFNVAPYYDDYDATKGYYRHLFRPSRAVQGRELTQIQTTMQNQISRFGKHFFKEGSIVLPGLYEIYSSESTSGPIQYVKVKDTDSSNNDVNISEFFNQTVTGGTTGIKADISFVLDGSESSSNTKTIYVDYTSVSNANSQIKTFQAGETLTCNAGTLVVASANSVGTGSAFRISQGVFFAKDHFISFDAQGIILDRYNDSPSCKVGFRITEEIIDYTDDLSLLDPGLESSNYSAPGADRLKLDAVLQVLDFDDPEGAPDFVTLFTIKDGVIQTNLERPQYNILQDEMAKRTYDESGHYFVDGLQVNIREHIDTGTNGGRFPSANGGNANYLSVEISPGVAYVQGYEIGKLVPAFTLTDKSRDYATVNSQLASASMGSYVTVKEFTGAWEHDLGTEILLYDTEQKRLSESKWSTGAQTGKQIGTAKLVAAEHNSGPMGAPDTTFDVYISDIRMLGSNTFSNVRSLYYDNTSIADMGADIVLSGNNAVLQSAALNPLLYYVGTDWTKTLKPESASDTTFIYKHSTDVANVASGTFNVSLPSGASQFPYGTATLSDTQKRQIMVALNADANVAMTGTVTNTGTTLTGTSTDFTKLNVGDKLIFNGVPGTSYISAIANATSLTLSDVPGGTVSADTFSKVYKNGDIVDLTNIGSTSGAEKSVSATPSQLSFSLGETLSGGTISATVSYPVSVTSAPQINKVLRSDRFVRINVANSGANTSGPFNLGIPDVYRIKEIRSDTSTLTSNTQGSNVTAQFVFDNGQRDGFYDHAHITPRSSVSNTTHLLVRLDYFDPDFSVGKGFFSVDSYPIDDANTSGTTINTAEIPIYKSPTSGATYDLRNYIDFRPVKTQTATDSTTVAGSSVSPSNSDTFQSDPNGLRLPAPFSQISFDYEYYLARKDVVVANKDGTFAVIRGNPGSVPITPEVQDSMMALGTLTITPYPSISRFYANIINRKDLACSFRKTAPVRFTMRDIGVLKDRIINLESYAALTLLEKAAADLKILDANGLDRFKNGIFVDTFTGHELGATYSDDYRIVVDPQEKSIRPLFNMDSVNYDYLSGSNVTKTGDLVTLSYTEVPYITQNNVTTTRNTERTTYRFIGKMSLTPSEDVWVDTQYAPDHSVSFGTSYSSEIGDAETTGGLSTTWNSWKTYVTGYKVYRGSTASDANLVGSYSSLSQAQSIAESLRNSTDVTIETLYASDRSGVEKWTITDEQAHSLGEKVIDVSLTPFIRPQIIKGYAQGLKPFAQYYVYFDGVYMSDYASPLDASTYASGNILTTNEGGDIRASANGDVYFSLRIPSGSDRRFTFGAKEVLITDNPTNSDDATSKASAFFTAQGLVQTLQETIISTRNVVDYERIVSQSRNDPSTILNLNKIEPVVVPPSPSRPPRTAQDFRNRSNNENDGGGGGGSCLAYAFQAKAPRNEDGIFITSVDVYVADKHPTLGAWFEIREMDAGGGITQNQVPLSFVWKTNDEIPIDDGSRSTPLNVAFEAPIFLKNGKTYAFIIHPESANPNYYLWCSRIGETDVNTGKAVTSRAYNGTLYTTNNNLIWTIVPDVDLAVTFNRASFSTEVDGVAILGNKPREKFILANVSSTLSGIGETFRSGDRLTLSSITGGSINVGDYLIGQTSGMNSAVVLVDSTYNTANQGYTSGETVVALRSNGMNSGVVATATLTASERANAVLQKSRETADDVRVLLKESNGQFNVSDYISNIPGTKQGKITNIDNFRYSVVDLEPSYLQFNKSSIVFEMKAYSNTGIEGSYTYVNPGDNHFFSEEKAIFSRSTEIDSHSGDRTNQVRVTMRTDSDYQSPVLDLARTHSIIIDNIINSNTDNETASSGGNLYNKYISKIITLAENQDAEDMRIVLTAYRPPNTDIKVWVKILHAEDAELFAQRPWIELEKRLDGDGVYSSLANRNEFLEYEYGFPEDQLSGPLGQVQYRNNANTTTFTGYKYFAVKIGLIGNNSAIVPRCADLQVLAIQI